MSVFSNHVGQCIVRTRSQLENSPVNFHLPMFLYERCTTYWIKVEFNNETYTVRSYLLWKADVVLKYRSMINQSNGGAKRKMLMQ